MEEIFTVPADIERQVDQQLHKLSTGVDAPAIGKQFTALRVAI